MIKQNTSDNPMEDLTWISRTNNCSVLSGEEMVTLFHSRYLNSKRYNTPAQKVLVQENTEVHLESFDKKCTAPKEFLAQYKQYTMKVNKNTLKYVTLNHEKMHSLFKEVNDKGGFYEVIGRRLWGNIARSTGYLY